MKHRWIRITLALVLALIVPVSLVLRGAALPDYYGESYYAELPEMVRRLYGTEGKKLVLVGGSNVAFGVDTALLEQLLSENGEGYTVCSFGLYGAVGISAMLELSRDALGEGDLVVLAFEPASGSHSTYFGATAFWKCAESAPELLGKLNKSQRSAMLGNYLAYLQERCAICRTGTAPKADGVYAKASFDETCNLIYDRAGNIMALGYDTAAPVDFGNVEIDPDFAQQVNDYCADAADAGARVWLSFSPVNRSALADESLEAVERWFALCNETFACPVISDPGRYILDSGWFYDNNFHLNTAGARVRTCLLAEDLLAQLGHYGQLTEALPPMPESQAQAAAPTTGDEAAFTYVLLADGGYLISGLTEAGREKTALTAPSSHDGKPVAGFTEDALSQAAALEELTLPQSVEFLPDGLFGSCAALERLVLTHTGTLCAITEHTFDGAEQLRFFVPQESYALYRDGDGCEANLWQGYLGRIYTY